MTQPRAVRADVTYLVTRDCAQQQFLLRPDTETNNAVIYCIAVASQRADVAILDFMAMANHKHDVAYDEHGNAPLYFEHCHKLLAKCMNVRRNRWENFFSSSGTSAVALETRADVIDKMAYTATNPVKAGLVARVEDWPGACGYVALISGKPLTATRPPFFFDKDGEMPESVTLELKIPAKFGDRDEFIRELKAKVDAIVAAEEQKRRKTNRPVLGRAAILNQSWRKKAAPRAVRRKLSPTIAARDVETRIEAIQRKQEFQSEYRLARRAWLAGAPIKFPYGTYWLRRFAGVAVESALVEKTN
jgi:putative transposase